MKRFAFTFIICSALLFWRCSASKDATTQELEHYLASTFRLGPDPKKIYCFLPANQCSNCVRYTATDTDPALNHKLVIISGFPGSHFKGFENVYTDKDDEMLRLRFLDYGNKFVIYRPEQPAVVIPMHNFYSQLDSLASHGLLVSR